MNGIIKNDYTEIQKYFDDYYKEQLKKYEELKYYDNYLFTNIEDEPIYWVLGLAVLGFIYLLELYILCSFRTFNFIYNFNFL